MDVIHYIVEAPQAAPLLPPQAQPSPPNPSGMLQTPLPRQEPIFS